MKRWQPIEKGQIKSKQNPEYIQATVRNSGQTMGVWYLDNGCSMTLPDDVRLCQLVDVDDPVSNFDGMIDYNVVVAPPERHDPEFLRIWLNAHGATGWILAAVFAGSIFVFYRKGES